MKNTFKYLVNSFLFVFLFFSLFLFPVFAEDDFNDSMGVIPFWVTSDEPYLTTEQLSWLDSNATFTNSIIYQFVSGINNGAVVYSNNITSWTDFNTFSFQGYTWLSSNGTASYDPSSVSLDFSGTSDKIVVSLNYNGTTYCNICHWYSSSLSYCSVSPTPTPTPIPTPPSTPTPTPIPGTDWDADFNEILSNPYIAQLVGIAKENDIESWYIDFTIKRTPNGTSGYTIKTLGYQYSFILYDSDSNYLESIIFNEVAGEECNGSTCRPLTSYTVSIENVTILKSSWLDVPESGPIEVVNPSGNDLLDNGNLSSQSASSSLNNTTSYFNNTASELESFESQFNSGMTSALANIDISVGNLGNVSDFVSTANFIKLQFDSILDNSGIYKSVITFSLILGLALLLIGRRS